MVAPPRTTQFPPRDGPADSSAGQPGRHPLTIAGSQAHWVDWMVCKIAWEHWFAELESLAFLWEVKGCRHLAPATRLLPQAPMGMLTPGGVHAACGHAGRAHAQLHRCVPVASRQDSQKLHSFHNFESQPTFGTLHNLRPLLL